MKLLLDFLPILFFFGTFRYADSHPQWAGQFASEHLGFMVSGGVITPAEAPVLLATVVVVGATLAQIVWLLARGRKVGLMLWLSCALVTVLGGATLWFHNETFIKLKPTVLYGVMALTFWSTQTFFNKNLLKALMGEQLELPALVWRRLNWAWIGFFAFMGLLNLYVAYQYSTAIWVNFKLFGGMGLMVLFAVAQGLYLSRHLKPAASAAVSRDAP